MYYKTISFKASEISVFRYFDLMKIIKNAKILEDFPKILIIIELLASRGHLRKKLFRIDLNQEPYKNIHQERHSVLRNYIKETIKF